MTYNDPQKRRETQRRYRERNRDKINEYQRTKYGAAYMRQWRDAREGQRERERAARKEYYVNNIAEERRKAREYMRGYYLANKEQFAEYGRQRYLRMKEWFEKTFPNLTCAHCGETDRDCLDFHHKNPAEKEASVLSMLGSRAKAVILREMEKCLVLCANCHRKEHARLRREQA